MPHALLLSAASTAGFQAGYIVGMVVGGIFLLGGLALFIVALVKAFTKKTAGWIVTAVFLGAFGLAGLVTGIAAAVLGVSRAVSEGAAITQVLQSSDGEFQITVPASWRSMPSLNTDADIAAGSMLNQQFAMVFVEKKDVVRAPLERYLQFTADRMASSMQNGSQGSFTSLQINGHPALRRSITGNAEGVDLAYLHTCVETETELVQIICWTLGHNEATAFPVFEKVAATFRSSIDPPAPTAGAPTKSSP